MVDDDLVMQLRCLTADRYRLRQRSHALSASFELIEPLWSRRRETSWRRPDAPGYSQSDRRPLLALPRDARVLSSRRIGSLTGSSIRPSSWRTSRMDVSVFPKVWLSALHPQRMNVSANQVAIAKVNTGARPSLRPCPRARGSNADRGDSGRAVGVDQRGLPALVCAATPLERSWPASAGRSAD
jgi:hypothetical protein